MDISATTGLPMVEAANPYKPTGSSELDRQDFMTLFITQLQYQDPMKPMDSYEMASQLAQFSSMDATMQMNANMEKLLDYQTSQNNLQLLTLLDKEILAQGNEIGMSDGRSGSGEFTLIEASDSATLHVYNATGSLVRSMDLGSLKVGTYEVDWDGMDNGGNEVEDGLYRYQIQALDLAGGMVDVDYRITGKVTGVQFDSGKAMLTLDDHVSIGVGEVLQVVTPGDHVAMGDDEGLD